MMHDPIKREIKPHCRKKKNSLKSKKSKKSVTNIASIMYAHFLKHGFWLDQRTLSAKYLDLFAKYINFFKYFLWSIVLTVFWRKLIFGHSKNMWSWFHSQKHLTKVILKLPTKLWCCLDIFGNQSGYCNPPFSLPHPFLMDILDPVIPLCYGGENRQTRISNR